MSNKPTFCEKAMPIIPEILKDIYKFLNLENSFDVIIVALFLVMFFLMTRKSNMVPMSVSTIISRKQLARDCWII